MFFHDFYFFWGKLSNFGMENNLMMKEGPENKVFFFFFFNKKLTFVQGKASIVGFF